MIFPLTKADCTRLTLLKPLHPGLWVAYCITIWTKCVLGITKYHNNSNWDLSQLHLFPVRCFTSLLQKKMQQSCSGEKTKDISIWAHYGSHIFFTWERVVSPNVNPRDEKIMRGWAQCSNCGGKGENKLHMNYSFVPVVIIFMLCLGDVTLLLWLRKSAVGWVGYSEL